MEASTGRRGLFGKIIKAAAFLLLLALALSLVSRVLVNTGDPRNLQNVGGYYEIPENTLDAVFIGSSRVYCFWTPMFAWNEYGIATANLAVSALPARSVRYFIEEAHKTQPDAVLVINIDHIRSLSAMHVQNAFSKMRSSSTRFRGIEVLADAMDASFTERVSYHIPLVQFHSRWSELTVKDFDRDVNGFLGSSVYDLFLSTHRDMTQKMAEYVPTETCELSDGLRAVMDDILAYLDKENIRALFINAPEAGVSDEKGGERAAALAYAEEHGYPALDLQPLIYEMGFDFSRDFINIAHVNIHGSLKYVRYLAAYLVEKFGFTDKRGDEKYDYIASAWEKYVSVIDSSCLDIERGAARDYALAVPQGLTVTVSGEDAVLSWEPVEGADGYAVYRRKTSDTPFKLVDTTTETGFTFAGASNKGTWTVVPYTEKDGVKYYGNFDYAGTAA